MFRPTHSPIRASAALWMAGALVLSVSGESFAEMSTGVVGRLNRFHEQTFMRLNSSVNHFDQVIGGSDPFQGSETNSEFRLTLYTEVKSGSVNEFSIEPDFEVDLNLPRIERRFHLFVNNLAPDELPGQSPLEKQRTTFIGVKQSVDWLERVGLNTSAGMKWRLPPVFFAQAQLSRRIDAGKWMIEPKQSFFCFSDDDGFGEKTSLNVEYWQNPRTFARSSAGARWTEGTEGVEWSHALSTGYILQGDKENMVKSIGARFVVAGHKNGSAVMDSYRVDVVWRAPLYRDWLFYIVNPEVTWEDNYDWEPTRSFIVGIDMFFSGGSD